MRASGAAGAPDEGMGFETVLALFGFAVGLLVLLAGLKFRLDRQRLRERGVEVEAVRTWRERVDEGAAVEVRFTTLSGETLTTWVAQPCEDGRVVYDPEHPRPATKRLGPFHYRQPVTATSPSYLNSWRGTALEWLFIGFGLFIVAVVVYGLSTTVAQLATR